MHKKAEKNEVSRYGGTQYCLTETLIIHLSSKHVWTQHLTVVMRWQLICNIQGYRKILGIAR